MKIALIQLNIKWEAKEANIQMADYFAKKAASENCDIIVFPEMFNSGFSMNIRAIAEDLNGETSSALSLMARKYSINIIAGLAVINSGDEKARNMAVAFDRKGNLSALYAKIHPFSFASEDRYYMAGDRDLIFQVEGVPVSVFICYDLRFPEVFRGIAKDVQAIFVIANWPSSRVEHWETLLKARAIENQCFIIGVNRTGIDGNGIHYCGASHIFGPSGNDMLSGSEDEEFLIGEINPDDVIEVRSKFPFLKDMRM